MISLKHRTLRPRSRMAVAIGSGCLVASLLGTSLLGTSLLGTSLIAMAQDQSAATAKDAIFARKTMMDTLSDNMDQIEAMISTNKIDLANAHDHADTISVMLMAFPHLFPPSTNQWKPNADLDPATDTYASPDVWTKFSDFYQRANAASKTAYNMSRAEKVDDLKAGTAELRTACNACHEQYLKTQ